MMQTSQQVLSIAKRLPTFDRAAIAAILGLSLAIGIVLWHGDRTKLQVTQFSWAGKKVGTQYQQFTLTFNRFPDHNSVEQNLEIEPPLGGKISWSGRNLFYTLTELPIYGINYQIKLSGAKRADSNQTIEPFVSLFNTRDRAFAYIGLEGQERGRLVLHNITQSQKTILTPPDLIVTDYEIYPQGEQILFSAYEPDSRGQGLANQQLYTVTTGLHFSGSSQSQRGGKIQRLLDGKDYQNLKFDLSANGKTLVVQRKNRQNPADSGLWVVPNQGNPRPLGVPGGDFVVSPNGKLVAVAQRGGVGLIPLAPDAGEQQFLSGYEKSLGFSPDGSQQLLVRDNRDFTRSLVLLTGQGEAKELFKTLNPIVSCQFEPRNPKILYCLKTDWVVGEGGQYQEEPYLAAFDMATGKDLPLLALPNAGNVQMSMSPDGVALLFDQVISEPLLSQQSLVVGPGKAIADGRLWLYTLPELEAGQDPTQVTPEELNPGFHPRWLP